MRSYRERDYERAKIYYLNALALDTPISGWIAVLKALSINCYKNKEYLMAARVLKYVERLGMVLNEHVYDLQSERCMIRKAWNKMGCANCGANLSRSITKNRLKACCGCMKVGYCNRKCQKIDWKKRHRFDCDKSWSRYMPISTVCDKIIDALDC